MWKIIENGHAVWCAETWKCAHNLYKLACIHYSGVIALVDEHGRIIESANVPKHAYQ